MASRWYQSGLEFYVLLFSLHHEENHAQHSLRTHQMYLRGIEERIWERYPAEVRLAKGRVGVQPMGQMNSTLLIIARYRFI